MIAKEKTSDIIFSVGTQLNNDTINSAKQWLYTQYKSKYSAPPHLTFLLMPVPHHNMDNVKTIISEFLRNLPPIRIELGDLYYEAKTRFFGIQIIGAEIRKIHEDLINLINPYRDGVIRSKDSERISRGELNAEEIALIERFGYFRLMDKYKPHISVGSIEVEEFNREEIEATLRLMLKDVFLNSLIVNELHVYFHKDSELQSEMKELWSKTFRLV